MSFNTPELQYLETKRMLSKEAHDENVKKLLATVKATQARVKASRAKSNKVGDNAVNNGSFSAKSNKVEDNAVNSGSFSSVRTENNSLSNDSFEPDYLTEYKKYCKQRHKFNWFRNWTCRKLYERAINPTEKTNIILGEESLDNGQKKLLKLYAECNILIMNILTLKPDKRYGRGNLLYNWLHNNELILISESEDPGIRSILLLFKDFLYSMSKMRQYKSDSIYEEKYPRTRFWDRNSSETAMNNFVNELTKFRNMLKVRLKDLKAPKNGGKTTKKYKSRRFSKRRKL